MIRKPSRLGRKPKNEFSACCSESPILTAARVFIEMLLDARGKRAADGRPRPVIGGWELSGDAGVGAADAVGALGGLAVGVGDVDLLLAHGLVDLALVGLDVLLETDALLGDGPLLGDGLFGVERDLVLFLGDRGAVGRVGDVRVGDRLALDPDLLPADGNGLRDLVFDHVLLQAHAAGLALGGADAQLLFGARHRVVGLGAADVVADDAGRALPGAIAVGALGEAAVGA